MRVHVLNILLLINAMQVTIAQPIFRDISREVGINAIHAVPETTDINIGTGAAWLDYDNDGDLDLYISQRVGANLLYRNNLIGLGESSFTNVASGDALDVSHDGAGVSVADYDNDGDMDIYLVNSDQDVLLENHGNGQFEDVTSQVFPSYAGGFMPGRGTTASWGDINNDGWLDLYISNHIGRFINNQLPVRDFLFLNSGTEPVTFTNISSSLYGDFDNDETQDAKGLSFAALFTDIDNDMLLDIYVTNDCPFGDEDNKIWKNLGQQEFEEVSDDLGPLIGGKGKANEPVKPDCQNAMGIAAGDVNRDGWMDYFYTNWNDDTNGAVLVINSNGENLFDRTSESGLTDLIVAETGIPRITWGTVFLDYDNDMLLDLAVAAGDILGNKDSDSAIQPNMLYKNTGIEKGIPEYVRVDHEADGSGFSDEDFGRTLIKGDYDLDGDLDLLLVNYGSEIILYENVSENENNWLVIDPVGAGPPYSNKDGIGAKIRVTTGDGITQYEEVRSGSSLGGGDDISVYFGLAMNESVDVVIQWPSGEETHYDNLEVNQRILLYEQEPDETVLNLDQMSDQTNFAVYPNPLEDCTTLEFVVEEENEVSISVYDLVGRQVYHKNLEELSGGRHSERVNFRRLTKGAYVLVLKTDDRFQRARISKY